MEKKLAILGLDGFNRELLDYVTEEDLMPNLERLIEEGQCRTLKSVLPCQSAAAWTSFYTGELPEDHGVFSFFDYNSDYTDIDIIDSKSFESETFYENLEKKGKSVCLINGILTWPPRVEEGVVLPGFLTGGRKFFPGNLDEEIDFEDWRWSIGKLHKHLDTSRNTYKFLESRSKAIKQLSDREWDLFFLLFSGVDWIQHQGYNIIVSEDKRRNNQKFMEFVDRYFALIDQIIGRLDAKEDTEIIIMSDHGMSEFSEVFYVNEWLREEGHLTTSSDSAGKHWDSKLSIPSFEHKYMRRFSRKLYKKLFLNLNIDRFIGHSPVTRNARRVIENNLSRKIDFDNSKAFVPAEVEGGIHVKDKQTFLQIKSELASNNVFESLKFLPSNIGKEKPAILFLEKDYKISTNILGKKFSHMTVNYHDMDGLLISKRDIEASRITDIFDFINRRFE